MRANWHLVNPFSHVENSPLSPHERETAAEVFEQYDGLDKSSAWIALRNRALETSRPFRAYDCAHAVAASQVKENSYCRDCGAPIPHGERFCDDCTTRMDLGDSEYQNRIGEENEDGR
jgi:hypothetical protein